MEVKVGQVWNDPHLGELRVAFADESYVEFESIDGSTVCIEKPAIYDLKSLKLLVDVQPQHLSDLEIVQKALSVRNCVVLVDTPGCTPHYVGGAESLLTWAKQQIGME